MICGRISGGRSVERDGGFYLDDGAPGTTLIEKIVCLPVARSQKARFTSRKRIKGAFNAAIHPPCPRSFASAV